MERTIKRNLAISSTVSLSILIISSVASFFSIRSLLDSNWWVSHTHEVIYNLNNGESIMTKAQTDVRGFLITGKKDFLEHYGTAEREANIYFDRVESLTIDNQRQQKALHGLKPLKKRFFGFLDQRIGEKQEGKILSSDYLNEGKELMDKVSSIMKTMVDEEKRLLVSRTSAASKYGTYSLILIVVAAILSLCITVFFFLRLVKYNKQRVRLFNELAKNERETSERIKVISSIAEQISEGNYKIRINSTDSQNLGSLATSLNNMANALDSSFQLLSNKEWLQTGIAELNNVMIGEKSLEKLSKDIIDILATYTDSVAATLYLVEGKELFYTAGYSFIPNEERHIITLGHGLTGQAALSKEILELKDIASENIKVSYALGEAKPRQVLAVPLIDGEVIGVAEVATLNEFSILDKELFATASHGIAVALEAARNRKKIQDLLEETQSQAEELQAQHSELEGMNAELEAQSQKLQSSEEELRVQQEELQQTNQELTYRGVLLEERNSEIQKKSEELELSTKYKSEFLANMSHELRTPLNSILLLSRLLSENNDKTLSDEQIEFARVIQSSGNGLLSLIDEILDLSKIEAGKMDLELTDVSVGSVTRDLMSIFSEVAKYKGITFTIDDLRGPQVLKTDRLRLEQILKNLISNAIKFTTEGGVSLQVKYHDIHANLVQFIVRDTGIGIPHDKKSLIFEAFQQADGSTKRKYGGTGLGLSISRELAKLLQGEISLSSELNKGSEFILTIPLIVVPSKIPILAKDNSNDALDEVVTHNSENAYLSSVIPENLPDDRDQLTSETKTILIVEDDIYFAKSLLEFSRKHGYKGIVCVRGDEVLDLVIRYKPIGILLDIQLPIKSGWEVMNDLKTNPITKHIPVHVMSSHKVRHRSLMQGAVHFLEKPIAAEQLPDVFKRIESIINRESHKVLIIEDNIKHAQALASYLKTYNINTTIKSDISEGVDAFRKENVDCVILDMGIPSIQAYEGLENIKKRNGLEHLPIIVFTGKSLSTTEEAKIKKYADSIIVKSAQSYKRVLDEVSLFLHLMDDQTKRDNKEAKELHLKDSLADKTVLVVDDDVRNIYSLTKTLELLKMNVITAIDGKEALKMLEEYPETSIVLLDMMMPNMDGYEAATKIRQNEHLKDLPIIAVTAKAMLGDREKCIAAGASDYITKPVDMDQLISLLRVWLYQNE